ncbi:hypothetical protein AMJ86_01085 [bacterium SM23_57]|nr:MAG: hypothetical protein AMJ86_01085 [bacterium SM23_57]
MSSLKYNILTAKLTLPATVYIVGSAAEGEEVLDAIPRNGFTICVNESIAWDLPQKNIWFVADPNVINTTYFGRWKQNIKNSGYDIGPDGIRPGCMPVPVFAESYLETEQWVQTYFHIGTDMGLQDAGPLDKARGVLRMQATSVGAAMQLAHYLGAETIYLVGVRLDGEYQKFKPIMDWLINVLERQGTKVLFLRDHMPDEDDLALSPIMPDIIVRESEAVPWVIDSDLRLPKEVFIVGSGPNYGRVIKRIPETACCIGLNRAVLFPKTKFKFWLVADGDCAERPDCIKWFAEALNRTKRDDIKRIWSYAVRDRAKMHKPDYIFRLCEQREYGFRQVPDKFRPDETIAGIALDLCHRQGVKHAVLVGVDMSGQKHADGSNAPGNRDDRHGTIWDSRDALDGVIRWMHGHGMRVSTLSDTQLTEPYAYRDHKLPTVALLTMAYVPPFTKNALFHAYIQDYPHHLITQYLIYQNDEQPFIATDLDIRLIQLNVNGTWPELWLHKLMNFFESATEDVVAIFDEDDKFTPGYISTAINALMEYKKAIVWNYKNRHMTRTTLLRENYRSPFGTMVGYRKPLYKVAKSLWHHIYGADYPEIPGDFEWGRRGCQDATYRIMLVRQLEKVNCEVHDRFEEGVYFGLHEGERWYVEHMRTNTCSNRRDEDAIDFWIPDPWWLGQDHFEKTRLAGNIVK